VARKTRRAPKEPAATVARMIAWCRASEFLSKQLSLDGVPAPSSAFHFAAAMKRSMAFNRKQETLR